MVDRYPDQMVKATAPEPPEGAFFHDYPVEVMRKIHEDAVNYRGDLDLPDDEKEGQRPAKLVAGLKFIAALAHGGNISGPRLLVVHSAETPMQPGYAVSTAQNWFATKAAGTSAHYMVDPANSVQMVHTYTVAYHVGAGGNGFTLGYEQAGYATQTRDQWLSPSGLSQMKRLAALMADDMKYYNIPVKRASDADIRRAASDVHFKAGYCYHNDIRRVLGGTTHSDPGPNYPDDKLLATVRAIVNPPPTPQPPVARVALSGTIPILKAGVRDPINGGGFYVQRLQLLLHLPVTGIYDATTVAKVKAENTRLLKRSTDGRTVDELFWKRIYGM